MGTPLTGTLRKNTYKWLLHMGQDGALPATAEDAVAANLGDGTELPFALWQGGLRVNGSIQSEADIYSAGGISAAGTVTADNALFTGAAITLGSGSSYGSLIAGAITPQFWTLPNATGTIALTSGPQTFSGNQEFLGTLILKDGSSSDVALRFASESANTGWYRTGAGGIGYVAAGALRFRIRGGNAVEVFTPELNLSTDVRLFRDAPNVLALRNETAPQVFRVYNSYTSGSDYEMGYLGWSPSGTFRLGTSKAGSGSARPLELLTDNVGRIFIMETGEIAVATATTVNGVLAAPNQNYATETQVATIGEVRRKVGFATGDLRTFTLPASSSYVLDYTLADLTGTQGGYAEIMIYGPFSTSAAVRGVFVIKAVFDVVGGEIYNAKVVVENPMTTTAFGVSAEYVDAESLIRITVTNLGSSNRTMSARVVHALGRSS